MITHTWKNGGDNSRTPLIWQEVVIVADADCDADGSPRATSIDPSGQIATSLCHENGWRGQSRYVNSETVPYYVLPMNFGQVTGLRVNIGDIALLQYGDHSVYAIFADQGPNELIGEASICAIEALGINPWNASHTQVVRGAPHGVRYRIQIGSVDLPATTSFATIQSVGERLFGFKSNPALVPTDPVPVSKKRVLINPGHWEKQPGASGKTADVKEHELNRYQADLLLAELSAVGINGELIKQSNADLYSIGQYAKGFDAFVSLHLNAYNHKEHYTCAMVHPSHASPTSAHALAASRWATTMSSELGYQLFSGSSGYPPGVMARGLSVLAGAHSVGCPIAFLSELEFVDDETETDGIKKRIQAAMKVGAKVIANELL